MRHEAISQADIGRREEEESGSEAYKRCKDHYKDFLISWDVFKSDGPNLVNVDINTVSGTLCTREELLQELGDRETVRAEERAQQAERSALHEE